MLVGRGRRAAARRVASLFIVDQRQIAIVFQLGEITDVMTEPGLNFKLPLLQNVRFFDKRILTLDNAEPERFLTPRRRTCWSTRS